MLISSIQKDKVGIIASTLCMIHCIATPFIFLAKSCSTTCCESSPIWWSSLDFLFLVASFFAIHHSNKTTSRLWVTYALRVSWVSLLAFLLNEKLLLFSLFNGAIYLPALALVVLHLYNLKYCTCETDNACAHS
jgi:hypothetical protein